MDPASVAVWTVDRSPARRHRPRAAPGRSRGPASSPATRRPPRWWWRSTCRRRSGCGSCSQPAKSCCWCRRGPRRTWSASPRRAGLSACPAPWRRSSRRRPRGGPPWSAPSSSGRPTPAMLTLAPLFERYDPATVAAARLRALDHGVHRAGRATAAGSARHGQDLRRCRQEGRRHGERPRGRAHQGSASGSGQDRAGGAAGRLLRWWSCRRRRPSRSPGRCRERPSGGSG